jgi:C-terminal processing protease CtpA/Prc
MSDAAHESLAAFATRLRTELAGKRFAVVDLRLNNGGEASLSDELLRTMIAFDVNGGRIATLISRMTFSAAETFATRLDQWSGTIFVGEATGSKPNHYGNERTFKLPHSALRGSIASGLNQPVTARDERTTIEPDVKVPLRSSDYFAGHDPALAAAIEALRR